jgi:heme/copper-type cytochrome/quinol oxidase subunit 2
MLKNYIKIALRNIVRHKGYSIINIAGLAVGMACCILILLWVQHELSYDRFHENADTLYRVVMEFKHPGGQIAHSRTTCPPLAPFLKNEYPEIRDAARFRYRFWQLKYNDKTFIELGALADPSFLKMFTFPLIKGDSASALSDPYSIVLTEELAEKYFGNEDPIGESIKVSNWFSLKVTGVIKNIPQNSHINFNFLVPFEILRKEWEYTFQEWDTNNHYTYIMLHQNSSLQKTNKKIANVMKKNVTGYMATLYLQPIRHLHLHDKDPYPLPEQGSSTTVYIFSAIALFVLIIACINFMNLATARYSIRTKEVGIRKVIGANRGDLIKQFFTESIFTTLLALICAIALVEVFLPIFNNIFQMTNFPFLQGKEIKLALSANLQTILGLFLITILTGAVSGSYPALFISSFQPVKIFRGSGGTGLSRRDHLRKILIVVQFVISIFLIIFTMVIYKQINYINKKNLGYERENVFFIYMTGELRQQFDSIKHELLKNPNVVNITASDSTPADRETWSDDNLSWEGKKEGETIAMEVTAVDYNFLETFNMRMAQGRFFSKEYSTDVSNYVVNEAAVKAMGMDSPLGKRFSYEGREGNIIGVIKDYHSRSLHHQIGPLVMTFNPGWYDTLMIKIKPDNISQTIGSIERTIKGFIPDFPFDYIFLDEFFDFFYGSEKKMSKIIIYFSLFAIFISCLGLFGLASFTAEQKTKEIGIRKILGATASNILLLLTKEFTKWVLIANIIAWPVAYYAMHRWLEGFAYRTNIGIFTFIISALLALMIALLTVSFKTIKAALADPIEALRYE